MSDEWMNEWIVDMNSIFQQCKLSMIVKEEPNPNSVQHIHK